MPCLVIAVSSHEGRFHGLDSEGRAEWPPSPARLFQALVAAACKGAVLAEVDNDALEWLEGLAPPVIAAPASHPGQTFSHFMPNNDLDAKGGDPRRIGEVRSATKHYRPRIFDPQTPILYIWSFESNDSIANHVCGIAEQLYQLGRGVDMAWAVGEVVDEYEVESRLAAYPGTVYRPAPNATGDTLPCPSKGSLHSLIVRYAATMGRFKVQVIPAPTRKAPTQKKVAGQTFAQPPKPHFGQIAYASPAVRLLYELRDGRQSAGFHVWPLREAGILVNTIRDDCAGRLEASLTSQFPDKAGAVKRVLGLCRDATEADKASRIRIIPLPSIGHPQADRGIRRILVVVPPNCPIRVQDIDWAFAGFCKFDASTGEVDWMLTMAEEQTMLDHYGIGSDKKSGFRTWRTVTPMALPVERPHGRNSGTQRANVEAHVTNAVAQALRHAGVIQEPVSIRVQREPFDAKGARAEDFAAGTRFAKERLWHIEIVFAEPVAGPLLLGDGRDLGLGLMAPVQRVEGIHSFAILEGLVDGADATALASALRRAVMSRVQERIGRRKKLQPFFSGHEPNGAPLRSGIHAHLAFAADLVRHRLLIVAPHMLEGRQPTPTEREYLETLDASVADLSDLRAGAAGRLKLAWSPIHAHEDPLFGAARRWESVTDYQPTRHGKRVTPSEALVADVQAEVLRRGMPIPTHIEVIELREGPRGGLAGRLRIRFATVVSGPILIGRSRHFGGGLFSAAE